MATSLLPLVWDFGLGGFWFLSCSSVHNDPIKKFQTRACLCVCFLHLRGQGKRVTGRNPFRNSIINPPSGSFPVMCHCFPLHSLIVSFIRSFGFLPTFPPSLPWVFGSCLAASSATTQLKSSKQEPACVVAVFTFGGRTGG